VSSSFLAFCYRVTFSFVCAPSHVAGVTLLPEGFISIGVTGLAVIFRSVYS
jgi:hypothetical protein